MSFNLEDIRSRNFWNQLIFLQGYHLRIYMCVCNQISTSTTGSSDTRSKSVNKSDKYSPQMCGQSCTTARLLPSSWTKQSDREVNATKLCGRKRKLLIPLQRLSAVGENCNLGIFLVECIQLNFFGIDARCLFK